MNDAFLLQYHTDDARLKEISEFYWHHNAQFRFTINIREIADAFEIPKNDVAAKVAEVCAAVSLKQRCEVCKQPLVYASRDDFRRRWGRNGVTCKNCLDKYNQAQRESGHPSRTEEQAAAESEVDQLRQILRQIFRPPETPDFRQLPLCLPVYFLSVIRAAATEDLAYARPLDALTEPLAPTAELSQEIVMSLRNARILEVHPGSDFGAFASIRSNETRFYHRKVAWMLPGSTEPGMTKKIVAALEEIFRTRDWPSHWHGEALALWKSVALHESLELLYHTLDEHHLPFTAGEKTRLVLEGALESYSVAQVFNFIWRAAKDAAAFLRREGVSPAHAANTVVGSIQRYAERAKASGWDVKPFGRNFGCPQSAVSKALFNAVLLVGDHGFTDPPDRWPPHQSSSAGGQPKP